MADPRFVFTGEVPARQLISSWQIDQANREGQRQQLAEIARNRNQQEQTGNQRLIAQAQLAEQMRQHDMANNQFAQEIEARKALQAAQIAGQKELQKGGFDFYTQNPSLLQGRNMAETNAALNYETQNRNDLGTVEASRINAMLAPLKAQRDQDLLGIDENQGLINNQAPFFHPIDWAASQTLWPNLISNRKKSRQSKYQQDVAALLQANPLQHAYYDPRSDTVLPLNRNMIGGPAAITPTPQSALVPPAGPAPINPAWNTNEFNAGPAPMNPYEARDRLKALLRSNQISPDEFDRQIEILRNQ